jgi:hypothetical protein
MLVQELLNLLKEIDETRQVYILDMDGTAQPVSYVVDLTHTNLPKGIAIPDDIALMTTNTFDQTETLDN